MRGTARTARAEASPLTRLAAQPLATLSHKGRGKACAALVLKLSRPCLLPPAARLAGAVASAAHELPLSRRSLAQ